MPMVYGPPLGSQVESPRYHVLGQPVRLHVWNQTRNYQRVWLAQVVILGQTFTEFCVMAQEAWQALMPIDQARRDLDIFNLVARSLERAVEDQRIVAGTEAGGEGHVCTCTDCAVASTDPDAYAPRCDRSVYAGQPPVSLSFSPRVDTPTSAMRTLASTDSPTLEEQAMPAVRRRRQAPVERYNADALIERACRVCERWFRRNSDNYRYDNRQDTYRTECLECERYAMRQRAAARRAGATSTRTARVGTGRAFGIEIELTGPSKRTIANALQRAGINVISRGYCATNGNRWELKEDGSVQGEGLELVSPKLYGAEGMAELQNVLQIVRSVGGTVDRSCGIHVHVDFRRKTVNQIKDSILPLVEAQETLWKFVAPSRRRNSYCPGWTYEQVGQLRSMSNLRSLEYGFGPRGNVNLFSYPRHGSIEFRSHGASLRYDRISAWVNFVLAACAWGEDHSGQSLPTDPAELLRVVGVSAEDRTTLLRFVQASAIAERDLENTDYALDPVSV